MDETYRDFITSGSPHQLFSSKPALHSPTGSKTDTSATLPATWSWRNTLIHLFSFSKSYCIPGHRLGLIVADPGLSSALDIALDNSQICAPRPPQRALAPLLPSLRPFVRETALAIEARHKLFKACLPLKWHIGSQGAYYAFVRHPFVGVDASEVSKRLAAECGVVTLPASFFGPGHGGSAEGEMGRWIRFSVANVDDDKVRRVCERLAECEGVFGWELEA